MKRSTLLIVAINVYGVTAAVLVILGVLRTPIIIVPFILAPFIIDSLRKSLTNPRGRYLSLAIIVTLVIAITLFAYLALASLR